ncbi:hypothetical protein Pan97_36100 [Bremerella volcania]|uniref:Uncharacterized protein n=1 Tax=Bremerella volcania TaxID=2527984 RepID=A0A518CBF6_9BACT|nr:hypothetical protein [Bremerella volcania]QDU76558.1 hypothetical protein Pan97_36100 [Bremerella volcania]
MINQRKILSLTRHRQRIRREGSAAVISTVLLVVILGIGVIVGTVALRDQIVQEFGDAAVALDNLDQSYSYSIQIDTDGDGTFDAECFAEYEDPDPTLTDPGPNMAPADLMFIPQPFPDQREGVVDNPSGEFP